MEEKENNMSEILSKQAVVKGLKYSARKTKTKSTASIDVRWTRGE